VISGDDRGCSSFFIFVLTDFRGGATIIVLVHNGFIDDAKHFYIFL